MARRADARDDRDRRDLMALAWDLRVHELEQAFAQPAAPSDDGIDDERRALSRVRLAATRQAVHELAAAISRLEDGTYGYCEGCERPIPGERLLAAPTGRLCTSCRGRTRPDSDDR